MPEFKGLKLSQDPEACTRFADVHRVEVDPDCHDIKLHPPSHIGSGKNSGFQALNIAVQFGARRIVLVGYDMTLDRGAHWHANHKGTSLSNPRPANVARWREMLDRQAKLLKRLGVEVVNASPMSALTAFPKMSLQDALEVR